MSEPFDKNLSKKEALKQLIKKLHEGADAAKVKEEFKELIKETTPTDIAKIEEELIKEGMPQEEIHKLCDVHIALFRESLEKEKVLAPPGHPIHILMEEHKILLNMADELRNIVQEIKNKNLNSIKNQMEQLRHIGKHLKSSESHYVREENVLFPYLEKHGITQPPAMMWMDHDKIREIEKNLYRIIEAFEQMKFQDFTKQLEELAIALAEMLSNHFYKENHILFPTALKVITETEWDDIRKQFDELGYCCFTPEPAKFAMEQTETSPAKPEAKGMIQFEIGSLSKEEIEMIFNTLPVDITFVDKKDTVRYFSQSKERIFPRTKAHIGLKVQQCHPQKSVHIVNQILEDFKSGKKDTAEFWINMKNMVVYIRYFAVRNKNGDYLGCLEVTQNIADIKKIEGEKRLL